MLSNGSGSSEGQRPIHPSLFDGESPPRNILNGLNLLIVDDQDDMRRVLKRVLSKHGAKVEEAASVHDALEVLAFYKADVIISDISMPEESGYDFIRKLRENIEAGKSKHSKTPAIALTCHQDEDSKKKSLKEGFQVHLGKPFNPQNLIRIVSALASLDGDAVENGVTEDQLLKLN